MNADQIPGRRILSFPDRSAWRSWLASNHQTAAEAWVLIQKKASTGPGIFLAEAVEEALCCGWIDSTLNPRDESSYLLRFSPRKPGSVWSVGNIRRVEKLIEGGLMLEAGLAAARAAREGGEWQAALAREDPDYLPPDLEAAFGQDPRAREAFSRLPASRKKHYIYWLQSAKQEETRRNRAADILDRLQENSEPTT